MMRICKGIVVALLIVGACPVMAEFPEPQSGNYVIKNFEFESGRILAEMNVSFMTIGDPSGAPVLITHGTNGSGKSMLGEKFAGNLYGTGQPLDSGKYFLILVDAIGT